MLVLRGDSVEEYNFDGSSWGTATTQDLGLGALYGLALDGADHAWVSSSGGNVSYISIPEPSVISMIALFGGGMGFIRRKFMI